jgi:hypothetical protein
MTRNCRECNEPIPAKRLLALPNARVCVACKETNDVPELREASVLTRKLPLPQAIRGPRNQTNRKFYTASDLDVMARPVRQRVITPEGHDGLVQGGQNHAKPSIRASFNFGFAIEEMNYASQE